MPFPRVLPPAALAEAAYADATFLLQHLGLENRELLPAADRLAEQGEAIWQGFERIEHERIGPGAHERLHRMIRGLPARIGPWLQSR